MVLSTSTMFTKPALFLEEPQYSLAYEETSNLPNTSTANHTPDVYELAGPIEDYENSSALAGYQLLCLILRLILYLTFSPLIFASTFIRKGHLIHFDFDNAPNVKKSKVETPRNEGCECKHSVAPSIIN